MVKGQTGPTSVVTLPVEDVSSRTRARLGKEKQDDVQQETILVPTSVVTLPVEDVSSRTRARLGKERQEDVQQETIVVPECGGTLRVRGGRGRGRVGRPPKTIRMEREPIDVQQEVRGEGEEEPVETVSSGTRARRGRGRGRVGRPPKTKRMECEPFFTSTLPATTLDTSVDASVTLPTPTIELEPSEVVARGSKTSQRRGVRTRGGRGRVQSATPEASMTQPRGSNGLRCRGRVRVRGGSGSFPA